MLLKPIAFQPQPIRPFTLTQSISKPLDLYRSKAMDVEDFNTIKVSEHMSKWHPSKDNLSSLVSCDQLSLEVIADEGYVLVLALFW
jgi:hypothetical protein